MTIPRLIFWSLIFSQLLFAREITTNQIQFINAPIWLSDPHLIQITEKVQNFLEWDIRRIKVYGYTDPQAFKAQHNLNFSIEAFFRKADATIHIAPTVTKETFDQVFSHELVHAIFFQKYKGAIPAWLEEGLANHIGKRSPPDYPWLAKQPAIDVTSLKHPDKDSAGSKYHYQASTALAEMIAKKCSLPDLLQLSVGSKLVTYLSTYCEIKDLNLSFKEWVEKKSKEVRHK